MCDMKINENSDFVKLFIEIGNARDFWTERLIHLVSADRFNFKFNMHFATF
jgi:hypothetical protein